MKLFVKIIKGMLLIFLWHCCKVKIADIFKDYLESFIKYTEIRLVVVLFFHANSCHSHRKLQNPREWSHSTLELSSSSPNSPLLYCSYPLQGHILVGTISITREILNSPVWLITAFVLILFQLYSCCVALSLCQSLSPLDSVRVGLCYLHLCIISAFLDQA